MADIPPIIPGAPAGAVPLKKAPARFSPKKKPSASICRPSRPPRRPSNCRRCRPAARPAQPAARRCHRRPPLHGASPASAAAAPRGAAPTAAAAPAPHRARRCQRLPQPRRQSARSTRFWPSPPMVAALFAVGSALYADVWHRTRQLNSLPSSRNLILIYGFTIHRHAHAGQFCTASPAIAIARARGFLGRMVRPMQDDRAVAG